jgi:nicotinate dehydrogenase subunit B
VIGNFAAVVADSEWGAIRAAKELRVAWKSPDKPPLPEDLYSYMRTAAPRASKEGIKRGDAAAMLEAAKLKLNATYEWPFQAHATMDPGCAVADFQAHGLTTVWCGAQKPHGLRKGLAQLLGAAETQVRVIWVEDAGSYGRAGYEDVAADAVLLSREVGKPVRVQWMRSDMTAWGGKGPATIIDLAAGFGADGIDSLQFTSRVFSGTEILPQPNSAGNLLAAQLAGVANETVGDEYSQWGEQTQPYTFANVHSVSHILAPLYASASPLRTTHLRDPGGPAGTFAGECFVDEIAAAARIDPVEFRLKYLDDARAAAVLKAAAERAAWDSRPSPAPAAHGADVVAGRGVAIALRSGTHVATVAEVEVNRRTGAVRVKRLICAHDCGLIINPEALRGTIAANLIQSLSRALLEEVTFDRDHVTSVDWDTYPVARASDVPAVDIVLLSHPELPSSGAGEPSTRPTAAAIGNAIFDATGARVRQAPLTRTRIKAAIEKLRPA